MTKVNLFSSVILEYVEQCQSKPANIIALGDAVSACLAEYDTKLQAVTTPYTSSKLNSLQMADLAIISDLIESTDKTLATTWLGTLKNRFSSQLIIIVDTTHANSQHWQLSDYFSLGFKLHKQLAEYQFFIYAIASYQPKRDWLNNRFWANPELYDKHRW